MTGYAKTLYDMWVPFLQQQGKAPRWGRLNARGLLVTSSRGFDVWDNDGETLLRFGTMDASRMLVAKPLFLVNEFGSFQLRAEDPATHCSHIWSDQIMFLRKFYHARRTFFTIQQPYTNDDVGGTYGYGIRQHYYGRHSLPPWRVHYLYPARDFIRLFSGSGLPSSNTWLRVNDEIRASPRLEIDDEVKNSNLLRRYDFLKEAERYSQGVSRRVAKKVEQAGGIVHHPPTRVPINQDVLSEFAARVDIYSTTKRPQEATQ